MNNRKRVLIISFLFGMLGCLCFGSGDWLMMYGYPQAAIPACEALFSHLSWIVVLSEAFMLPPFVY